MGGRWGVGGLAGPGWTWQLATRAESFSDRSRPNHFSSTTPQLLLPACLHLVCQSLVHLHTHYLTLSVSLNVPPPPPPPSHHTRPPTSSFFRSPQDQSPLSIFVAFSCFQPLSPPVSPPLPFVVNPTFSHLDLSCLFASRLSLSPPPTPLTLCAPPLPQPLCVCLPHPSHIRVSVALHLCLSQGLSLSLSIQSVASLDFCRFLVLSTPVSVSPSTPSTSLSLLLIPPFLVTICHIFLHPTPPPLSVCLPRLSHT